MNKPYRHCKECDYYTQNKDDPRLKECRADHHKIVFQTPYNECIKTESDGQHVHLFTSEKQGKTYAVTWEWLVLALTDAHPDKPQLIGNGFKQCNLEQMLQHCNLNSHLLDDSVKVNLADFVTMIEDAIEKSCYSEFASDIRFSFAETEMLRRLGYSPLSPHAFSIVSRPKLNKLLPSQTGEINVEIQKRLTAIARTEESRR